MTASHLTYGGGTIFVDHASGFTQVKHQVSLSAGDTIQAKRNFERLLFDHGVIVRKFQADNGVFNSAEFEVEIEKDRSRLHTVELAHNIKQSSRASYSDSG